MGLLNPVEPSGRLAKMIRACQNCEILTSPIRSPLHRPKPRP